MTALDQLLDSIFDGRQPALYHEFEGWIQNSRRFRTFTINYRSKIRTKLRNVRDEGGMQDLRTELETAMLLLRNERFTLEYEKYAATKQRGPDFTVTYKTHTPFNVEVRRIRSIEMNDGDSQARSAINPPKLMAVLCDKVEQMPPSIVNLLWLVAEREISKADVSHAVVTLRQLAEDKTQDLAPQRSVERATAFIKQYHRLSGIALRSAGKNVVWLNPVARHQLPREIMTAIQRLVSV